MSLYHTLDRDAGDLDRIILLAEALHRLRYANGAHAEGLAMFERILGLPGLAPAARATAALHAAEHARRIGLLELAVEHLSAARADGARTWETDVEVEFDRANGVAVQRLLRNVPTAWAIANVARLDLERGRVNAAGGSGRGEPGGARRFRAAHVHVVRACATRVDRARARR